MQNVHSLRRVIFGVLLALTILANILVELGFIAIWVIPELRSFIFGFEGPGDYMMIGIMVLLMAFFVVIGIFLTVSIVQHILALVDYLKSGEIKAAYFVVSTYTFYYIGMFAFLFSIASIIEMIDNLSFESILVALIINTYFLINFSLTIWASIKINRTQKAVYHPIKNPNQMIPSDERN